MKYLNINYRDHIRNVARNAFAAEVVIYYVAEQFLVDLRTIDYACRSVYFNDNKGVDITHEIKIDGVYYSILEYTIPIALFRVHGDLLQRAFRREIEIPLARYRVNE